MENETPTVPPRPALLVAADLDADELDIEIDDASDDTRSEAIEHLGGAYDSLGDYFRRELEDHIDESIAWVLNCLDMTLVQRRFEGDGRYRYYFENGSVYRVSVRSRSSHPPRCR
jgi:hypothetical protein